MNVNTMQTWFITGAGSGLGLTLTQQLLLSGQRVAATTRSNTVELECLQKKYPKSLWVQLLDVTHTEAIEPTVSAAFAYFGSIDVLVNNAGYILLGALEDLSDEQIDLQLNTNLRGSIDLIRAFLPYLRKQGQGRIVQISSEAGQIAYPTLTLYHASKWGIEGFCEALSREMCSHNIQVMIVEPGCTETNLAKHAQVVAPKIECYQRGTVGQYMKLVEMGRFPNVNDPQKVVLQIIHAVQTPVMPLRLVLGADAYKNIERALKTRLNALEAQHEIAYATAWDVD